MKRKIQKENINKYMHNLRETENTIKFNENISRRRQGTKEQLEKIQWCNVYKFLRFEETFFLCFKKINKLKVG